MVYKVFFQEDKREVPVREHTKVLYFEANSEKDVRIFLKDRPYNIELVQLLSDAHLQYEQEHEAFSITENLA